jgi:hypothetical protein
LKVRCINKDRDSCLVLLHGLYANSGFWLPYLNLFKGFRIYLIDLDYLKLTQEKNDFVNFILEKSRTEDIKYAIGHSFGGLFLDYCGELRIKNIGINPAHFGHRKDGSFIEHVAKKQNRKFDEISIEISQLYSEVKYLGEHNSIMSAVVLADNDEYFNYSETGYNASRLFSGTHFEIKEGILEVLA